MPQECQCHENRNLSTCSLSPWSRIMCAQSWQSINTEGGKEGRKEVCMGKIIQNNDSENRATLQRKFIQLMWWKENTTFMLERHTQNVSGKSLFEELKACTKRSVLHGVFLIQPTSWCQPQTHHGYLHYQPWDKDPFHHVPFRTTSYEVYMKGKRFLFLP